MKDGTSPTRPGQRTTYILIPLLAACIARLWLMPLSSSLWVDELVTVFVVRYPGHPSFAAAPQVPESIYYVLPRLAWTFFGSSEAALRLPSVIAMGAALFFIARIAARLIHPAAAWFGVFACLAFRTFDYFAADARPYGLGIAVASAGVLFLIRWFDHARGFDEGVFILLAALLWRVHLFYWPFYLLFAMYGAIRLFQRDTRVSKVQIAVALAATAGALAPVAGTAIRISGHAAQHAFNELPTLRNLFYLTHCPALLTLAVVAWIISRLLRWPPPGARPEGQVLIFGWWLICPISLFLYSRISGNGVLIMRYASLMLPGIALAATAITARFIPPDKWKPAAVCVGIAALGLAGDWNMLWPSHERDDWREAAALERSAARDDTPVICPSPFIEAQPPLWTRGYPFPSFLYSHLQYYTLKGKLRLFPFASSPESERYLQDLVVAELAPSGRFVLYGSGRALQPLDRSLMARPEFAGWRRTLKRFDEISVIVWQASL